MQWFRKRGLCVPIPHSLLSCILISSSKLSISSLNRRNSPNKPPTQLLAFGFVVFVNHWDGNPFSFNLLSHVYNGRYYRQGAVHYSYFLLRIFPCKQNLFQARVKFIRYSGIIQYLYINNSTVVTDFIELERAPFSTSLAEKRLPRVEKFTNWTIITLNC